MIVNLILWLNMTKNGLLECNDQEISGVIDRNPGREAKVRSREVQRDVERVCRVETERQQTGNRQATPLAYTPCQRFKASCASYADGSLRLLCAPPGRSGFHTAFFLELAASLDTL